MSEMSLHDVVRFGGQRPHRKQRRDAEKRRRRRRRRTLLVLVLSLVIVVGAVGGAWVGLKPILASLTEPKDWAGEGNGSVVVQIPSGSSGAAIGRLLEDEGVVKTAKAFADVAGKDTRSQSIQPGSYKMRLHMSAGSALELLLDPQARLTVKVTIPEGFRLDQILDALAEQTGRPRTEFEAALKDPAAIGLPEQARGGAEGYLYPATYSFEPSDSATQILSAMTAQVPKVMAELGIPADKQRGVLIEASLIQAEAGRSEDMPKISRVLANRLAKGMKLELDTTVHYATKRFTLTTTEKDLQVDSPYNTYKVQGLPPGPICSPGKEAISAVIHPADGSWLWFTTVNPDTGETEFASTIEEKRVMDAKWRQWQAAHPGQ